MCSVIVLQVVKMLRAVKQGLGRDTTDIQTGAAERRLSILAGIHVDTGGRKTQVAPP